MRRINNYNKTQACVRALTKYYTGACQQQTLPETMKKLVDVQRHCIPYHNEYSKIRRVSSVRAICSGGDTLNDTVMLLVFEKTYRIEAQAET
jgi:hypothetical protein